MRKTQSTPCFQAAPANTPRKVSTSAVSSSHTGSSPIVASSPIPPPLLEHVETMIPSTFFQYTQCMEMYGRPEDILKAPALVDDTLKSELACMITPDEAPEPFRPSVKLLPTSRLENIQYFNERFERLFLSFRRRRRRMTI